MLEQGINVDHATLNRCVLKYPPIMKEAANYVRKITAFSWRVDETYIKPESVTLNSNKLHQSHLL